MGDGKTRPFRYTRGKLSFELTIIIMLFPSVVMLAGTSGHRRESGLGASVRPTPRGSARGAPWFEASRRSSRSQRAPRDNPPNRAARRPSTSGPTFACRGLGHISDGWDDLGEHRTLRPTRRFVKGETPRTPRRPKS